MREECKSAKQVEALFHPEGSRTRLEFVGQESEVWVDISKLQPTKLKIII